MKQFSCSSLTSGCNVVLTTQTEERLAEKVSLHLREVHGMTAISQDMVGRIKRNMVNRSMRTAASDVDLILEKYNCEGDPECTRRYIAEAEMILRGDASAHGDELKAA